MYDIDIKIKEEFVWTDELVKEFSKQHDALDCNVTDEKLNAFKQSKLRKPLFTTEDGMDVFSGGKYWIIDKDYIITALYANDMCDLSPHTKARFSTESAAKEYVLYNKPVLCLKDVIKTCGSMHILHERLKQLIQSRLWPIPNSYKTKPV